MCGFFAIYSDRGLKQYQKDFSRMNSLIRHRGPDDEGFVCVDLRNDKHIPCYGEETPSQVKASNYLYSPKKDIEGLNESSFDLVMGHRRLSIIDLSPAGHQPMSSADGRYWIVYNGEVYNFKEIRKLLVDKGVQFQSNTDTEVVLYSYIQWGEQCLEMFNGMWAFCIMDIKKKELFVSRDRFGIKPLYYYHVNGLISFFSEIKVLKPLNILEPHYKEMIAYLYDGMSEANAETFYKGVYRFPAGNYMYLKLNNVQNKLTFQKYWSLEPASEKGKKFEKEQLKRYCTKYYDILNDAVACRLVSDVPVGFLLSGGLDSSSIVYLADKVLNENGNESKLFTLSNIYTNKDERYCDESGFIHEVLKSVKAKSVFGEFDNKNILQLNDVGIWHAENAFDGFFCSGLNMYSFSRNNLLKVALNGHGGDELLGGYRKYWKNYFAARNKFSYDYWYSFFSTNNLNIKEKTRYFLGFESLLKPFTRNYSFIRPEVNDLNYRHERISALQGNFDNNISIGKALTKTINNNLKRQLRMVDCSSMAYSVEARQPYLDHHLVNFLNEIPSVYKMRMSWSKYLTRKTFEGLLPDSIVWRRDKMGFPSPLKVWLKSGIKRELIDAIHNNDLLNEMIMKNELDKNKTSQIIDTDLKFGVRLYNLTRTLDMFFDSSINYR
jgi:asparagine synthase (glutamine-hydrolysing)